MKLRVPDGCAAASLEGRALPIAADGSVDVEDAAAQALAVHGFLPWPDDAAPPDLALMTRDQLIMHVMDMTLKILRATDTDAIRARLVAAEPGSLALPDERAAAGVQVGAREVVDDDVSRMNRPQLFAYLRAKGVPVSLPITNDELRAAVGRISAAR